MRTYHLEGSRNMRPISWHTSESYLHAGEPSWSAYTPYTNVLWLRYLLYVLTNKLRKYTKDDPTVIRTLEEEVKELKRRFDTRTKVGAFNTAAEVMHWMCDQKWLDRTRVIAHDRPIAE